MIIDKVQPFWTEEEKEKFRALKEERDKIFSPSEKEKMGRLSMDDRIARVDRFEYVNDLINDLIEGPEERYIESFNGRETEILSDIKEIIDGITMEDFSRSREGWRKDLEELRPHMDDPQYRKYIESLKRQADESRENCESFIRINLRNQLNALMTYGRKDDETTTRNLVKKKAASLILTPAEIAREAGAVMNLQGHMAGIASNELFNALTIRPMKFIGRLYSPDAVSLDGQVDYEYIASEAKRNGQTLPEVTEMRTAFMNALLQAASISQHPDGFTLKLYVPGVCKDMGIDGRIGRLDRFEKDSEGPKKYEGEITTRAEAEDRRWEVLAAFIAQYEAYSADLPDGSSYRIAVYLSYDAGTKIMTVAAPYIFKLLELLKETNEEYKMHSLFHANVIQEQNTAAVELAFYLVAGYLRSGKPGDRKFNPTYKTIIENCPQLAGRMETAKTRQAKNTILTRTFQAAYRIIDKKSDFRSTYPQVSISTQNKDGSYVLPTQSTLANKVIIKDRPLQ